VRFIKKDGTRGDGRVVIDQTKCWACGDIDCLGDTGIWICEGCGRMRVDRRAVAAHQEQEHTK